MKRLTGIVLALCMLLPFTAGCGKQEANTAEIANPLVECTQEELTEKSGISLDAPEGAENVQYTCINGDAVIAQVDFTLDGKQFCYRAVMTNEIMKMNETDKDADIGSMMSTMEDAVAVGEQLSGYYEKWSQSGMAQVSYCDAVIAVKKKGAGFICWQDVVPGIVYTLSMGDCDSSETLITTAEACFVPAQGEVG